ncbi:MAG: hypothetical protein ABJE47_15515 [bacterium]
MTYLTLRSALAAGMLALMAMVSADGPTGTLVVSNMNDNTVTVLDVASGRVLATLPTGEGPHEVAASHDGRWAVVSNYGVRGKPGHTLTVVDIMHLSVARTIDLGSYQRPHGMAFFPGDTLLAVTCQTSKAVLLVDLRTDVVVGTVPTNGLVSHMLAMSSDGARLFTANMADGTITQLDVAGRAAMSVIPTAKSDEGIAISPDGSTVFVGSNADSIVVVVDVKQGQVIETLRGFGLPYRMAVSPDGRRAVITDPVRGEIRILDAKTRRPLSVIAVPRDSLVATAEVPGSPSPEGVAMATDSKWAFVTLQGRNRVVTVDLERGTITRYAPTGVWSDGVAYSSRVVATH